MQYDYDPSLVLGTTPLLTIASDECYTDNLCNEPRLYKIAHTRGCSKMTANLKRKSPLPRCRCNVLAAGFCEQNYTMTLKKVQQDFQAANHSN
jgi:hypothetical protein